MKKGFLVTLVIALALVLGAGLASAEKKPYDWGIIDKGATAPNPDNVQAAMGSVTTKFDMKASGANATMTVSNPILTPLGKGDTKGKGLFPATTLAMMSGIEDMKGVDTPFVNGPVKDGAMTAPVPQYAVHMKNNAEKFGVVGKKFYVVEHYWGGGSGSGGKGHLCIDPKDPWATYKTVDGKPDLETLAYGVVFWDDGRVTSLKSLGKGKLPQGVYFY